MNHKKIIVGMVIVFAANIASYVLVSRSTTADQRAFDRYDAAVQQDHRDFKAAHDHQKIDEKYLEDYAKVGSFESARYEGDQKTEIQWRSDVHSFLQMANLLAALVAISKLLQVLPKSTVLRPSAAL